MATTYAELQAEVADFLNRDDLTAVIPSFIQMAEAQLNRDVRHRNMEVRKDAQIDDQYLATPSDFLEVVRLRLMGTTQQAMNLVSRDEMADWRYNNSDVAGKPLYYCVSGCEFELYPTPDSTYDIEILYVQKIPALTDENTTNWLLTDAPDLYLYAVLVETAIYLRDDERLASFGAMYQSKLAALNTSSRKGTHSGTGLKLNIRSF